VYGRPIELFTYCTQIGATTAITGVHVIVDECFNEQERGDGGGSKFFVEGLNWAPAG
jgi:hypothetical protein